MYLEMKKKDWGKSKGKAQQYLYQQKESKDVFNL
jgi:hypothetical protein